MRKNNPTHFTMTEKPPEQQNRPNSFTRLFTRLNHGRIQLNNHLANRVGGCALCGASTHNSSISARLCARCAGEISHHLLDATPPHRCVQCAHLLPSNDPICGDCLSAPPAFTRSVVFGDYAGALKHALRQYKFHNALHLAPLLADCLRTALHAYAHDHHPDLIVLVPALPERTQMRGFNPLRLIVQQINWHEIWPANAYKSESTSEPTYAPDALIRVHHERLQIHVKPDQRRTQVKNAFALAADFSPRGQHIALIDDIITTGATLHEIAQTLKQSGARQVDNVLIARTPKAANK